MAGRLACPNHLPAVDPNVEELCLFALPSGRRKVRVGVVRELTGSVLPHKCQDFV